MPSPLDAITYNQEAGYLPVNLVAGDDLSILSVMPFVTTSYTFSGSVLDSFGNQLVSFSVTNVTPNVTFTLTGAQTATIPVGATYYFQWVVGGLTRTFLSGPINAVAK